MDKSKLKQVMIDMEQHIIDESNENYEKFLNESIVGNDGVIDMDDHSHAQTNAEISENLDKQIHEHQEHLQLINDISFEPTDVVRPGAVVLVNGRCMVVAVPKTKFQFAGKSFIGISTEAPIYALMHGKKAGEEFMLNGQKFTIEAVK